MAVSLVHKTVFTSVGGTNSGTINLSAVSTIGNWLLIVTSAEGFVTLTTDQAESIPRIFQGTAFLDGPTAFYLIQPTTKTATSVNFTVVLSRLLYMAVVYEISGTGLSSTLFPNVARTSNANSVAGNPIGPASGTSFFASAFCCGNGGGSSPTVSAGWNIDSVNFFSGNNAAASAYQIGTGTLQATFTISSNNQTLDASTNILIFETGGAITDSTAVVSNIDPSNFGQNVTFTATVTGIGGTGSPTGTITFNIDGHNVATVAASAAGAGLATGQFSISTLSVGIHPVFASYSGDSQFPASVSPIIDQLVVQPCPFPFATALQQLANRLYDSTMQFWSSAELTLYLQEALRTWNALASYWRGDFTLQSQQGIVFYDITNQTTAPNTLRPHTITDVNLYTIMQYHLLEPAVGAGPWTGSLQFSMDDLLNALQRRQNELLGVTGCAITDTLLNASPDRIYMPNTTLDIRRVAYVAGSGAVSPMYEDDTWGIQAFNEGFTTQPPGVPSTYRKSTEPVLSFDADAPPLPGTYDIHSIESGPVLTTVTPSTFPIPDDWMWVLKWGALADLLGRESNAKDLLRAKYCEGRYRQGLSLLAASAALLAARSNNLPLQVDAVKSADLFNPTWQGQPQGSPGDALVAGLNLIALSPPPDAGPYSLTLTVVENAPVANPCIQLTQDVYDVVIDYAQHLAAFKMGGAEFLATEPLLQRFMQLAALYSSKLAEQGEFTKILYAVSQQESNMNPRYSADSDPAAGGDQ